jgi:hypothetical protein
MHTRSVSSPRRIAHTGEVALFLEFANKLNLNTNNDFFFFTIAQEASRKDMKRASMTVVVIMHNMITEDQRNENNLAA